ncbi:PAS domain S-box-containing protein/diguanylate cyclase (GGDEF) domain-containing protein [Caminicella sporogenes DSM 14501]|uniref:PAS domain S-box-containing protein/diguanylate cyclase (GGDEF) domain-containing protein n=1 Tax=Caminicella sporogenes DSM 14501 TaxID=1121266 RepID=A0A1M6PHH0_9FIRM|nr:EAL domain-containing protein [Caminicella sporogenes]RKD21397.1 hypothetical protein BET04_08125 [Caminicella sporogenes]SHK07405.1 PAS domain S-box-containing protein/diguanylate cyclase (GGDEF) domain-containing protein [Caminicella sporogenes DSM 14501]
MKKNINFFEKKIKRIQKQYFEYLKQKEQLKPKIETLKIIIVYIVFGFSWIILSDGILSLFVKDIDIYNKIQIYKGWFYIVITSILFYLIIYNKIDLFKKSLDTIHKGYEDLSATYEELTTMDEELNSRYEELQLVLEKLRQEKELSDSIIKNTYAVVVVLNKDGTIKRFNPFAERLTGYLENEVIGKKWLDIFIPEDKKDYTRELLKRIVNGEVVQNQENKILTKDGRIIDILWNNSVLKDSMGNIIGLVAIGIDITQMKLLVKKLKHLAYYDTLTGLPNANMFEKMVNEAINQNTDKNSKMALIYFDIDNFKYVNDILGHKAGDILLKKLAYIIKTNVHFPDFYGRMSGDGFAILLKDVSDENNIIKKVNELSEKLGISWNYNEHEYFITVSKGIALYPYDGKDYETLLKNAETAMYKAKESGKNSYKFYSKDMYDKTLKYIEMSDDLRKAIENKEFVLYYQPLIDLKTDKIVGVEALIRWYHPQKGFIPPLDFIPLAEELGYIDEIEEWIIETVCRQKREWEVKGFEQIKVSINISSTTLTKEGFISKFEKILNKCSIESCKLEIEITETALISDLQQAIEAINRLKKLGFSIALDDFGTGYSSLTYLNRLSIDSLKIDREFIRYIEDENRNERYIVQSIIKLAHDLKLRVIAEGIETYRQLELLKQKSCDIGQGYYFSKPVPSEEIEKMFTSN